MPLTIAVVGGTGAEGRGLALRWAAAGRRVLIGSREAPKAVAAAAELTAALAARVGGAGGSGASADPTIPRRGDDHVATLISGHRNEEAARLADIVVLSVPYAAQAETLEVIGSVLAGKTLVTCVVPLRPPKVSVVWHPQAGSAAAEAQERLGDATPVVAAFHHVAAGKLADLDQVVACDVFVCGDSAAAKAATLELAQAAGLRAFDVGPLANAGVVEGLTSLLIGVNRRYGVSGAGVALTGMADKADPNTPA